MSKIIGYEKCHYRDHNGRFAEQADMEPASQPLYAQQSKVEKLPLPTLKHTADLFLESARPHVSEAEYKNTVNAVNELLEPNGLAAKLQARLEEHKKKSDAANTSWLINWWNDYAYMSYRDSVVYNVSYYLQFKDESACAMKSPTRRAARWVTHALKFRDQVASGQLTPDMGKNKQPWSNTQFKYMFNSCRMPVKPADIVRTYAPDLHNHICVARKNRFYTFDVYDKQGNILPVDAVQKQLLRIVQMADAVGTDPHPFGILSAENRDVWTEKRQLLLNDPNTRGHNEASLEAIQSSILMICLDDTAPATRDEVGKALLYSDGRNRFWDKSMQVIFFENGKAGYVGEHSYMDGTTTTRMVNATLELMFKDAESFDPVQTSIPAGPYVTGSGEVLPEPAAQTLVLSGAAQQAIKEAEITFDGIMATKELKVLMFHGYGKNAIKKFKVSPDAYAQMVIQLAYYKTFGHCRGTYESTQTRTYLHGRTEVTRSVSNQSVAFTKAMCDGTASRAERFAALQAACAQHIKYISKASKAMGCDRHLLGLKLIANKGENLKIFSDPAYVRSGHWALSTSGLVGELMDGWGFGEVVPDGLGIGYSVQNERIRYTVTSRHRWADAFCANLESSLVEMQELCEAAPATQSKL